MNVQQRRPADAPVADTMWALLERVAELERRVGASYERFAVLFRPRPLMAAFWNEMAREERLHALRVAATREVFAVTAPAPSGKWVRQLGESGQRLGALEAASTARYRVLLVHALGWLPAPECAELRDRYDQTCRMLTKFAQALDRPGPEQR